MLHIVSFNVPYPADYGGVIDVYYRLRALHRLGQEVTLHSFCYGRAAADDELLKWCSKVYYYPRATGLRSALSSKPYIVKSRESADLIATLKQDNEPIFLEGLHCCSVLEALQGRKIMVRAHNVEHQYYGNLAQVERNPLRRLYLRTDANRLRRYEPVLLKADAVFAVTEADAAHFRSIGCANVVLMPSSHPDDEVVSQVGKGDYALYHGDLSVGENVDAVCYLIEHVFSQYRCRFVVAGRNPSPLLYKAAERRDNIVIEANPDDDTMQRLIANAQVLVLVTKMATGLKLKLLNSLYAGRHCLVNSAMVSGTELGKVCTVADTPSSLIESLKVLMEKPFTDADVALRRSLLGNLYSNEANARILLSQL